MAALKFILPLYMLLFMVYGVRNFKMFLVLTGLLSLPFRTDYLIYGSGAHNGWSGGIIIALSDISFIVLFMHMLVSGQRMSRVKLRDLAPALAFIGACVLSAANSIARMSTFFQVFMVTKLVFLYYFVLVNAITTKHELKTVVNILMISLLAQGILGCMQFLTGYEFDIFSTGVSGGLFSPVSEGWGIRRVYGTINGKPNVFGAYVVPLILMGAAMLLRMKYRRKLYSLALAAGGMALILSFSRGAWASFFVAGLVLLYLAHHAHIHLPSNIRMLVVFGILCALLVLPIIKMRMTSDVYKDTAMSRLPLIKLAMNMIRRHPLIGVGANTFSNNIRGYVSVDIQDAYLYQVHNQYLLVFAETGIIGFCAYAWLLKRIWQVGRACIRHKRNYLVLCIGIGGTAGLSAMLMHMMVDIFTSRVLFGSMLVLWGLFTAALSIARKDDAVSKLHGKITTRVGA